VPEEETAGDAAALVMRYIERGAEAGNEPGSLLAALPELLRQISTLRAEVALLSEARRKVEKLTAYAAELEATVRRLEIGFRRHVSQRVSPDQLALVLSAQPSISTAPDGAPAPSEGEQAPQGGDEPTAATGDAVDADSSTASSDNDDPKGRRRPADERKRDQHGRRRSTIIPQIIIDIVPPEVRLEGMLNYERIGHEDSPIVGYRRGGPVELVFRRHKYVKNAVPVSVVETSTAASAVAPGAAEALASGACETDAASAAQAVTASAVPVEPTWIAPTTADATDTRAPAATDATDAQVPAVAKSTASPCATEKAPSQLDAPAALSAATATGRVRFGAHRAASLHEVAEVPKDTSFKRSPFADGVFVWYAPPPPEPGSTDPQDRPAVLIAPPPERPICRGLVDAGLIAHLLVHKQDYHTPFYRQEVEFDRLGWPLSRGSMARYQYESGELLMRLSDAMWQQCLERSWFAMDATGTAIRAPKENRYGHVFVLVAPGDAVLFRFTPTNDGPTVHALFGGYTGTVVADASANHNILFGPGKAREGGCWQHARKPFYAAFKAGEKAGAAKALHTIQQLFRIEKDAALCSPEQRLAIRQQYSAPLVDDLFAWCDEQIPLAHPESLVRKGLVYLTNQRVALREFLVNGEIPISNNISERALRRIVKGRMNWLSHGSDEHAVRACAVASLIASCEVHGLDPELYLQEVLTVLPTYPLKSVLDLSPKYWIATRQRLIAEGRLRYIDLAALFGSKLSFRPR